MLNGLCGGVRGCEPMRSGLYSIKVEGREILNSDKTNQTLREIVACCQNIQQLIEYFGDNPTILHKQMSICVRLLGSVCF